MLHCMYVRACVRARARARVCVCVCVCVCVWVFVVESLGVSKAMVSACCISSICESTQSCLSCLQFVLLMAGGNQSVYELGHVLQ